MARSAIPAAGHTTRKHCSHSSAEIAGSAVARVKLKGAQRFQDRLDPTEKLVLTTGRFDTHRCPPQGGAFDHSVHSGESEGPPAWLLYVGLMIQTMKVFQCQ